MTHPRLLVHTSTQSVRWGDMDALGHVNNTVYFRYMEQARIEWLLASAGAEYAGGQSSVIVNASCDFLVPLVYPCAFEVRMYLGNPGRSSVGSFYEIDAGATRHAIGAAKIVWVDRATGRSVPLPAAITSALHALSQPTP